MSHNNEKNKTSEQGATGEAQQEKVSKAPEAQAQGGNTEEATPSPEGEQGQGVEATPQPLTPSEEGAGEEVKASPEETRNLDRKDEGKGWVGGHTLSPTPPTFEQDKSFRR